MPGMNFMIDPHKTKKDEESSNAVCVYRHISLDRYLIFIVILNLFYLVHVDTKKEFIFHSDKYSKLKYIRH